MNEPKTPKTSPIPLILSGIALVLSLLCLFLTLDLRAQFQSFTAVMTDQLSQLQQPELPEQDAAPDWADASVACHLVPMAVTLTDDALVFQEVFVQVDLAPLPADTPYQADLLLLRNGEFLGSMSLSDLTPGGADGVFETVRDLTFPLDAPLEEGDQLELSLSICLSDDSIAGESFVYCEYRSGALELAAG